MVGAFEPTPPDPGAAALRKKGGVSPYHICYTVPSLEETVAQMRERRWVVTAPPEPAPALEGRRVAFLYHTHAGLIELLEEHCYD